MTRDIRNLFKLNAPFLQIFLGIVSGLLLGVAGLLLSWPIAVGVLIVVLFGYAILKRPELGLLGILIATSSIVFEDQLPTISVGISLHIPDILLIGLLGLIVVRSIAEPGFRIVRTPLDWPLLVFYGMMLLSTILAIYQTSVDIEPARREIRVVSYYLTFFIVTNLVRERRQLDLLLKGFFILGIIVAAAIIAQFLLGTSIQILPGRVESLGTTGTTYADVTRILPPGWSVVLVSFVTIFCILILEKTNLAGLIKFLICGLLGFALLSTFLRSYWVVIIMVFCLLAFMLRSGDRQRIVVWGFVAFLLAVTTMLVVFDNPDSRAMRLVNASTDRLLTIFDSGTYQGKDSSLNWRMIENGYAISAITSHPLLGLGMSAQYRPWDTRLDSRTADFRTLIHNGHLGIMLDSGLLGYGALIWLSLTFLLRGFKHWQEITDSKMRGVVLGFTLVYLALLIAAAVNSTFTQWRWTPVIGIMLGVNEIVLRQSRQNAAAQ